MHYVGELTKSFRDFCMQVKRVEKIMIKCTRGSKREELVTYFNSALMKEIREYLRLIKILHVFRKLFEEIMEQRKTL